MKSAFNILQRISAFTLHRSTHSTTSFLFKQTMKALFVGGIIMYTYKEGLWSDAFKSSCFLGKFVEKCPKEEDDDADYNEFADLSNIVIEDPEACQPFIPRSGYILYRLGYAWNQIILTFFWFITDGPSDIWAALFNLFKPKPKPVEKKPCIT